MVGGRVGRFNIYAFNNVELGLSKYAKEVNLPELVSSLTSGSGCASLM